MNRKNQKSGNGYTRPVSAGIASALIAIAGMSLGCSEDSPMEKMREAGEDVGNTFDEVRDDIVQPEGVKETIEEAGDEMKEMAEAAEDEAEDAADRLKNATE